MRNFNLLRVTLDIEKRFRMDFMTIKQASENGESAQGEYRHYAQKGELMVPSV